MTDLFEAVETHQIELALEWARVQDGEIHDDDDLLVTIVGLPVSFTNNVRYRRVILGGTPGHRTVRVPPWMGIDTEGNGGGAIG